MATSAGRIDLSQATMNLPVYGGSGGAQNGVGNAVRAALPSATQNATRGVNTSVTPAAPSTVNAAVQSVARAPTLSPPETHAHFPNGFLAYNPNDNLRMWDVSSGTLRATLPSTLLPEDAEDPDFLF